MKKGILVVSFGTSHLDTMERTIIRKLKRTENMEIDTVPEALRRMAADGMEDVVVQPTHIINGIENDRMMEDLMENMSLFRRIRVGKPLLSSVEDYKKSIHAVMAETGLQDGEMDGGDRASGWGDARPNGTRHRTPRQLRLPYS